MPVIWRLADQDKRDHRRLIKISREATMGTVDKQEVVTMQELLVSSLAKEEARI